MKFCKLKFIKKLTLLLVISLVVFSCSKKKPENSAEYSYIKAMKMLKDKRYIEAAEAFEKIDDEYPLSKWAIKGQTMAAYAFYKQEKYDEVVRIVDNFIHLNPNHEDVAYMQYLKAISYYQRMPDIKRGQDYTKMASVSFRELIAKFPNTKYSDDSMDKLLIINEHLAGAKMSIGRYQMDNQFYIGAIKNFNEVVDNYSQTKQAPEAYFRLAEIYYKIGIKNESRKALLKLKESYQDNQWWYKYGNKLALRLSK
jgi:outer membrane protein assembly factor BamD